MTRRKAYKKKSERKSFVVSAKVNLRTKQWLDKYSKFYRKTRSRTLEEIVKHYADGWDWSDK